MKAAIVSGMMLCVWLAGSAPAAASDGAKGPAPLIIGQLAVGSDKVCGVVLSAVGAPDAVFVQVTASDQKTVTDWVPTRVLDRYGEFQVTLHRPLADGDTVRVVAVKGTTEVTDAASVSVGPVKAAAGTGNHGGATSLAAKPSIASVNAGDTCVSGVLEPPSATKVIVVVSPPSGLVERNEAEPARGDGSFHLDLKTPLVERATVSVHGETAGKATTATVTSSAKPAPVLQGPIYEGSRTVKGYVPADLLNCTPDKSSGSTSSSSCVKKVAVVVYGHVSARGADHRTDVGQLRQAVDAANRDVESAQKAVDQAPQASDPRDTAEQTRLNNTKAALSTAQRHLIAADGVLVARKGENVASDAAPQVIGCTPADTSTGASEQQFVDRKITGDITAGTGEFTVSLDDPLIDGETIHVIGTDESLNAITGLGTAVVSSPLSWGRVHGYVTAGGVISKGESDFSKVDPELQFLFDATFWQFDDIERTDRVHTPEDVALNPTRNDGHEHKHVRFFHPRQVNVFFDLRLTSIGVSDTKAGTGAATAAASTPTPTIGSGADLTGFLSSSKASQIRGGMYMPMFGDRQTWTYDGERNALFVAPTFAFGEATPETPSAFCDVCQFFSAGLMFGHQKLADSQDRSPELISFLRVSAGKWNNIREDTGGVDAAGQPIVGRRLRWEAEGRLKIPRTIFEAGFDANVGHQYNDLRFILAARVDIGQVLGQTSAALKK